MAKPTLRGLFLIDSALSTELVTALLPTGDDSTLTDIHESVSIVVSNEGNTQLDEAMDTDQRQPLIGINQGKDLERLTSDVMNQKVSPNALAESQELVKLDNTLACLKNTLKSTWERQSFGCSAWITLRSWMTSYVARDWECEMDIWKPSSHYWIFSQRHVIFTMPSLLASVSRKCASLLKSITLCEGVRDNGRDCGQT